MIRILRTATLNGLLRAAATARLDARAARRDLAELSGRYRALVGHLARRDPVQVLAVPVPTPTADLDSLAPLTVVLLALWYQAALEREAFRSWVTEEPPLVAAAELQARAAEAAGDTAQKDSS